MPRQKKLTHNHALPDETAPVKFTGTGLPYHLRDRRPHRLWIIRRAGIADSQLRIPVFKIRKVDIHKSIQHFQRFHLLIAAGIINDRNGKASFLRLLQCENNLRNIMTGGDQIDVVGLFIILKFQEYVGQTVHRYFISCLSPGNFLILAVNAAQRTAGKKHGPGTFLPGYAWLLPQVKRRPGNFNHSAGTARTGASFHPGCTAFTRAKMTGRQMLV